MRGVSKSGVQGRGPQRTTKQDWIDCALETLVSGGVENVKVLVLSKQLNCARSSFYWYFKNRSELLDALLDHWQATNTKAIVDASNLPAATINHGLVNVFACWVTSGKFDTRLDFAVRDWARRSGSVHDAMEKSDAILLDAVSAMFERFGYSKSEAEVRARIIYYTQIGYNTLDVQETMDLRVERGAEYLFCMTGMKAAQSELDGLAFGTNVAPAKI
jgi:AcrR family transcriptional regulator